MSKKKDIVTVVCYGILMQLERRDAIAYFRQAMRDCSGAEGERYMNIWFGLTANSKPKYIRDDGVTSTIPYNPYGG